GVFLVGISYLVLNLPIANAMVLAFSSMIFITIGEIISMPFMNTYWISRTNNENRGQYAALYTVAWSSAQAIGPFFGAQLAEHFGYYLLWWVIGTICILLLPAYWLLQRRK
ncbi:MAG: MFS transporter, partial [Ferruginibacter sp.]